MSELPWDDDERMPALLQRIETTAAELLVDLERERRIWRAHQPALRRDPDATSHFERWLDRVARHLAVVRDDARDTRERPVADQVPEPRYGTPEWWQRQQERQRALGAEMIQSQLRMHREAEERRRQQQAELLSP